MYDAEVVRFFREQITNLPFDLAAESVEMQCGPQDVRVETIQGGGGRRFSIKAELVFDEDLERHLLNLCVYSMARDFTPTITATGFAVKSDIRQGIRKGVSETVHSLLHDPDSFFRDRYFSPLGIGLIK